MSSSDLAIVELEAMDVSDDELDEIIGDDVASSLCVWKIRVAQEPVL